MVEQVQKADPGEEKSATPTGTWTCDLSVMSPVFYQWSIPAPLFTEPKWVIQAGVFWAGFGKQGR